MKPTLHIVGGILLGMAALLIFLNPGDPESPAANHEADGPTARKLRNQPPSFSEALTIAENASRPSEAHFPQSDSPAPSASTSDDGKNANSDKIRKAIELRKALREHSERYDEATGNYVVLQPAAWMDLGEDSLVSGEHQDGIQQIASELREKIADSGLDPSSPAYRKLWNDAVRESNWKFRARYGARAWSRHHVQAFHSSTAGTNQD